MFVICTPVLERGNQQEAGGWAPVLRSAVQLHREIIEPIQEQILFLLLLAHGTTELKYVVRFNDLHKHREQQTHHIAKIATLQERERERSCQLSQEHQPARCVIAHARSGWHSTFRSS
jgi:hypothetical protein